ncbi:hypothetical protein GCM10009087_05020 [Sphingomonas oligophenolica]|uniref:Uncharacterized protein n=1 Tax=Sphingomonas oligophenolica TaxID=301154 RepID=A0ABU9YCA9_9SPHN
MQLKLRRSQKTGGMVTTNAIFCLDARVEFTPDEQRNITRYKLGSQVIYNSEAQLRLLNKSEAHLDGTARGTLKSLAITAFALTKLRVTVSSLQRGQHIECKTLDELLGAENAIYEACNNLKGYLATAATFDGREVLIEFDGDQPTVVAQATTPQPQLIAPAPAPTAQPEYAHYEQHDWEPEPGPSGPEYVARPETFGLPFDWDDPDTRRNILVAGAVLVAIVLLYTLHLA